LVGHIPKGVWVVARSSLVAGFLYLFTKNMRNKSKQIKIKYQFEKVSPEETQKRIDDIFDFIFDKTIEKLINDNKDNNENREPKT